MVVSLLTSIPVLRQIAEVGLIVVDPMTVVAGQIAAAPMAEALMEVELQILGSLSNRQDRKMKCGSNVWNRDKKLSVIKEVSDP